MLPPRRNQQALARLKGVLHRNLCARKVRKRLQVGGLDVHCSSTFGEKHGLRRVIHYEVLLAVDLAQDCIAAPRIGMQTSPCTPGRDEQASRRKPVAAGINAVSWAADRQSESLWWKKGRTSPIRRQLVEHLVGPGHSVVSRQVTIPPHIRNGSGGRVPLRMVVAIEILFEVVRQRIDRREFK